MYVVARKLFSQNGTPNCHCAFDAGAAWMSLALQARTLGLYAHAMAGFNSDKAYALLKVSPNTHDILAAVAIGHKGEASLLPDALQAMEAPNERNPLSQSIGTL